MPTALVTGATAGLGQAYARALAARGFDLVLVARTASRLGDVAGDLSEAYGIGCEVLPADLADLDQLATVEARLADPGSAAPIGLLVNNAGFGLGTGFLRSSVEDEQRTLDVLVRAVMRLCKAAAPGMVERHGGTILNVSSMAGFIPYGTYGAAKAWVTSFSESLAVELGRHGVRVLAVCPGFVHTEFHDRADIDMRWLPELAWLTTDDVVQATLRYLDSGGRSPVLVPTGRYRALAALARHAPRGLVRRIALGGGSMTARGEGSDAR